MEQLSSLFPATAFPRNIVFATVFAMSGLCSPLSLFGQNFFAADKLALNTPPNKTTSIKSLAEYLCAEQPSDAHKARAVYAWVSLNIAYVDSTDQEERWATPEYVKRQHPQRVLLNRTAVCQGYANLFCALATEAGLSCEVVTGLVKNSDDEIAKIGHAWAAALINGEWQLFDPTWGVPPAGTSRFKVVDKYFMADPKDFVLKHLPDDPMWQLLENPLTERQFRVSFDEEILDFISEENEGKFKFRDTLNHWIAMDSLSRLFSSEGRVLRFNGSNERVLFSLGQRYWALFFELQNILDSMTDQAILSDTLQIDTIWFDTQISLMDRYHKRARTLFDRLETTERSEKTEKFYTQNDVAALLDKSRGDMHTSVFEYLNHSLPEGVLKEPQIAQLRFQFDLASKSYRFAESKMDCAKMANNCFDLRHNRSLMAIQLGRHQVYFAQDLANDNTAAENLKTILLNLREARSLLLLVIEDCERMRRQPPKFAFVDERIVIAQQWLLTLRSCEIRAARTALSTDLDKMLSAQKIPSQLAKNLAEKMSPIARSIAQLKDTLTLVGHKLGEDFAQIAQFNLQLENFALQFNHANLLYRIARNDYEIAITKNTFPKQREHIRYDANQALQMLKQATAALDFLEDSGRLPASSIVQKQSQVNKLSKGIREFMNWL